MKILPNKRLSFIIAGCITPLLISSSLFSGLLPTTSTRINTLVALTNNYLIQQAVAQDAGVDEQTTQGDEQSLYEEEQPPGGEGGNVTAAPPASEAENQNATAIPQITPTNQTTAANVTGGEITPPPDGGEGETTLPTDEVTIPPSGGTPPPGAVPYVCDSTSDKCTCWGATDCVRMGMSGVCEPNGRIEIEHNYASCRWKN